MSKKEIIRCLKRYIARDLFFLLPAVATPSRPIGASLQSYQPAERFIRCALSPRERDRCIGRVRDRLLGQGEDQYFGLNQNIAP